MKGIIKFLCVIFMLTFLISQSSAITYAAENQQSGVDTASQAISRMNDLNILNYSPEDKDKVVSREVFSKAIVIAAGYEDLAGYSSGYSYAGDVKSDNEYSSFINISVNKRLMDILMTGNNFYPASDMTFADACIVMVRTLGYYTLDSKDTWQAFYVNKANSLGVTKDLTLQGDNPLTVGTAAIMFDRLLNSKSTTSGDKKLYELNGLYTEVLVLGNSLTNNRLNSNQIETDKGVYNVKAEGKTLELGFKYRVKIKDNDIVNIYTKLNTLDINIVDDKFDLSKLPQNINYYYSGSKKSYNEITEKLVHDSSVLLVWNDNRTAYEFGVAFDPVYSEPIVVKGSEESASVINMNDDISIFSLTGQPVMKESIKAGDVIYKVQDIYGNSRFMLLVDNRAEGRITAIDLNYVNNKSITLEGKDYDVSDLDLEKLYALNLDDKVAILIGHDGKVIDVEKIKYKSGPVVECIVTGNDLTTEKVGENQVITNLGAYFVLEGINLEVGGTYKVVIDDGTIVSAEKVQKTVVQFEVSKLFDYTITYNEKEKAKRLALPKLQAYYYDGSKIDYASVKDIIKEGSTVLLVKNKDNTGYEYGIIIDSVYKYTDILKAAKDSVKASECIILGNSLTTDYLSKNQVITNLGTYYYLDSINLSLGYTYKILTDGNTIVKADIVQSASRTFAVEKFIDNTITYFDGALIQNLMLPRLSYYYYQGSKIDYNTAKGIIKSDSTLILVQNEYNTGYEYGIIFDPKYSSPVVNGVGQNSFDYSYDYMDVIYTITDIYGKNSKTIAVDNKVTGQITAILPNRTYPTVIQVGGKDYEISKYYDYSKKVYFNTGLRVNLILGYDGKIVDIY